MGVGGREMTGQGCISTQVRNALDVDEMYPSRAASRCAPVPSVFYTLISEFKILSSVGFSLPQVVCAIA
jgi:hypothetical protein